MNLKTTIFTIKLVYFIHNRIILKKSRYGVKPPIGTPGVDVFFVDGICEKCNRHFLIKEEIHEHQVACQ